MAIDELTQEFVAGLAQHYSHVQNLNLSRNNISQLKNLSLLVNVCELDLSFNRISVLENLHELPSLRLLNCANNQILEIGDMARVQYLFKLDLSDNLLSEIELLEPLAAITSLTELRLKGNPLGTRKAYRYRVFQAIPSLQILDGIERQASDCDGPRIDRMGSSTAIQNGDDRLSSSNEFKPSIINVRSQVDSENVSLAPYSSSQSPASTSSKRSYHPVRLHDSSAIDRYMAPNGASDTPECIPGIAALEEKIERLQNEVLRERSEMGKLHTYFVGKTASEVYHDTTQASSSALNSVLEEKALLERQLTLKDVQIQSLQHILDEHDSIVMDSSAHDCDGFINSETRGTLLAAWRKKTLQLLIQLKSKEIQQSAIAAKHSRELKCARADLVSAQQQARMTKEQAKMQKAESELLQTKLSGVEIELRKQQDMIKKLRLKERDEKNWIKSICAFLRTIESEWARVERFMGAFDSRIFGFEKRITFALSRLDICKQLIADREEHWKQKIASHALDSQSTSMQLSVQSSPHHGHHFDSSLVDTLQREISNLMEERSTLLARISDIKRNTEHERASLRRSLESEIEEQRVEVQKLSRFVEQGQADILDKIRSMQKLEARVLELESQLSSFEGDAQGREHAAIDEARRLLKEAETRAEKAIHAQKEENETILKQCKALKRENNDFASTIRHLERRLLHSDQVAQEKAADVTRFSELTFDLAERDREIETLRRHSKELESRLKMAEERVRVEAATANRLRLQLEEQHEYLEERQEMTISCADRDDSGTTTTPAITSTSHGVKDFTLLQAVNERSEDPISSKLLKIDALTSALLEESDDDSILDA